MRYLISLSVLFIYSSCKKSDFASRPSSNTYLATIKYSYNRSLVIDSFSYDSQHRITSFVQHKYDSNGVSVIQARLEAAFQYNMNESIPTSYLFRNMSETENHSLTYDSQNRIIKDTALNGTMNVIYYSYSDGVISSVFLFGGRFLERQLDSIFLSNNNVFNERFYYSNGNPIAKFSGSLKTEFSAISNPTYQPAITSTIGPLLHILSYDGYGGFWDFTSKNLYTKITFTDDTNTTTEESCYWNTNANGSVINGTISGPFQAYVEFSYH